MRYIFILLAASFFSVSAMAATSAQPATSAPKLQLAANDQFPHQGKVLSSIDASIYTYIEVSENGKNIWLAAPTVAVKKGDTVGFDEGQPMANFYSKSLDRTFPVVYFVGKAVVIK
ncbi:MAG: NrfJ-related protein [Gallionellaceae bacterium]